MAENGLLRVRGTEASLVGIRFPTDLTREEWLGFGRSLAKIDDAKQWLTGDWWNALQGEDREGWGSGPQICEDVGLDYDQARKCGSISSAFDLLRRRNNLSFGHHQEVAVIKNSAVQDRMLDWCLEPLADGGKPRSTRELREQVRAYLDEQGWTDEERERRVAVQRGESIVVNQKTDERLIRWAQFEGLLVKVDRTSDWGNPYELDKDGDRDHCCDAYERHLIDKRSLLKRIPELKGKVLACWCDPARCHAHHLASLANELIIEEES